MTIPELTEFFVRALCMCFAAVIATVAFMGTAVLVSVIVGFGIDKIREIKRKREEADNDKDKDGGST